MMGSYILLGIWTFIVLFPIYWLFVTAFKLPIDVSSGPKYLMYVDFHPSTHAWKELLVENGDFVTRPYRNSVIVALSSSLLALTLGALASYALSRFEYRPKPGLVLVFIGCVALAIVQIRFGVPWQIAVVTAIAVFLLLALTIGRYFKGTMTNDDIAFWLISQRMLPPVVVIIPIYIVFQKFHLLNTYYALVITYTAVNLPLAIWFMRDYFKNVPIELEESAFIDGASRYQVLYKIILPLSAPGLVATFLIILVFAWNEYLLGLFLSGADTQTLPVVVVGQNATRGPQWWSISVLVLLMIAPVVFLARFSSSDVLRSEAVRTASGWWQVVMRGALVGVAGLMGAGKTEPGQAVIRITVAE
jgi:multiple sugar transport system permease protein